MGARSRNKGKRGELEFAHKLQSLGVGARRGVQYQGGAGSPDVVTACRGVHFEVKRVEALRLYDSLQQAIDDAPAGCIPVVAHRRSRHEWVAILSAGEFVALLKEAGRV